MTDRQRAEAKADSIWWRFLENDSIEQHVSREFHPSETAGEPWRVIEITDNMGIQALADAIEAVEDEFRRECKDDEYIGGGDG